MFSQIFSGIHDNLQQEHSMQHETQQDLIDNPSPRCPVALVLDTSGSMDGAPMDALNAGAQLFIEEVKEHDLARWSVDLAVYTAGDQAQCLQQFIGIEQIAGISPCKPAV